MGLRKARLLIISIYVLVLLFTCCLYVPKVVVAGDPELTTGFVYTPIWVIGNDRDSYNGFPYIYKIDLGVVIMQMITYTLVCISALKCTEWAYEEKQ